jgi:hypothetical protein
VRVPINHSQPREGRRGVEANRNWGDGRLKVKDKLLAIVPACSKYHIIVWTAPFISIPNFSGPGRFITKQKSQKVVAWWYLDQQKKERDQMFECMQLNSQRAATTLARK